MKATRLDVLLAGRRAAVVDRDPRGRWTLEYDAEWRASPDAIPLSVSLPLAGAVHEQKKVEAFAWGLLPDNDRILDRWAQRFHVSPRNPFALLAHVGEDCAGAVQFVRPERTGSLSTGGPIEGQPVDESEIALRLRLLRRDHAAWRAPMDAGQFSLAGAQPKTALLRHDGAWIVPLGRTPTTHILKPPSADLDGHVENEHFCLALARAVGLPAATSEVVRFEDEVAIVVERYDRAITAALAAAAAAESAARAAEAAGSVDGARVGRAAAGASEAATRARALAKLAKRQPILRLHQEDLCQAFGLPPTSKYQNEGGPSPEAIVALLRTVSSRADEDLETFVDALAFHWLVAGTDAHAKNYSLLHGAGGRVRLAPLYDLASALPYKHMPVASLKLAMKVGGEYRMRNIGPAHWQKLAKGCRLDEDDTLERVGALAGRVSEASIELRDRCRESGLTNPILDRVSSAIKERAVRCRRILRTL